MIVNVDAFEERNLTKAGYTANPLEDGSLDGYTVFEVPMTSLTQGAVEPLGVKPRDAERSKNFFALGLVSWMYTRPVADTIGWIEQRFSAKPQVRDANLAAFKAGHAFGETAELFDHPYEIDPAALPAGHLHEHQRQHRAGVGAGGREQAVAAPAVPRLVPDHARPRTSSTSCPSTSASACARCRPRTRSPASAPPSARRTAVTSPCTTTSGPGMALKAEAMGLAVSLELPLLIIDIQRGGPSTGLPTKTEAADLLMALYGRHGESPLPVLAAHSPSDCFFVAIEAARIAIKYRTPVILLSDGYLANGTEPWLLPDVASLPDISTTFATELEPRRPRRRPRCSGRTCATPTRSPAPGPCPARPASCTASVASRRRTGRATSSYDSDNHERMVQLRAAKVAGIADDIPELVVEGDVDDAELLVVGWGSTWGAIDGAVNRVRNRGRRIARTHLTHLNPFPRNLGEVLARYPQRARAGDEPRPAVAPAAGGVPRRRQVRQQGAGRPVHGRRARAGHPRHPRRPHTVTSTPVSDPVPVTTRKDWSSDQEVRWCPGCGDYSILSAVQLLMPELGVRREDTVFVSGIGCAARFPYYMNTYGLHSIHGRAPAIATGLAMARPDLKVWVVSGDGDALSIGGNHLIHALRRNVNLTILMFNNQIYGLTKGQYSPTSELGKVTKSTPFGSLDHPFNPISVAIGAEASFVARTHDMDRAHMIETFRRAHEHQGSAFVEVFQNCNVFNDGAFEGVTAKAVRDDMLIPLRHGEPIRFGANAEHGVVLDAQHGARIVQVADVGEDALLVHDESPHRSQRRLHAVPPGPRSVGAHAHRRLPGRAAPRVRRGGHPPDRRGGRVARPRRPRGSAPLRRHLGGGGQVTRVI